jgi:hypothetical protein
MRSGSHRRMSSVYKDINAKRRVPGVVLLLPVILESSSSDLPER